MLRKLLVVGMLIVMSMAVPFASTASAGQIMVTVPKTDCLSMSEKTMIRDAVALTALAQASKWYATQHGVSLDDTARLTGAEAMKEYMPQAVRLYRGYLMLLGRRIVLARGAACTRSVVAFLNGSGLTLVAEEELAQGTQAYFDWSSPSNPVELTPGPYGGGGGGTPAWAGDNGGGFYSGCCISAADILAVGTTGFWGEVQIAFGIGLLTNTPATASWTTAAMVYTAIQAVMAGWVDLWHAAEKAGSMGGLCGCPADTATH